MSEQPVPHRILGRYQLLVPVARGGMGQVWLGRLRGARGYTKLVAIKTLLPNAEDRPRLEAMLAEEARLASLIHHANVVHTMELGENDGLLYLVMEWVDGEPLSFLQARAAQRGGMPWAIAVALVSQLLAGLHGVHELCDESGPLGVVHRDVSPHNVLVTYDGVAKLLDFGIAKATEQPSGHTETGEIKGKFSYMAPEQILGEVVDRRCDVFAAGIILYWLLTGHHPFKHPNTATVIHAITSPSPVARPSTLVPSLPEELEEVLMKALAKSRDERFASAEDMRAALEQALPEAFGDAGRSALSSFMHDAVGDRRSARREALRRAQIAADSESLSVGGPIQAASSQSASSLGAISLSRPAPEIAEPSSESGASAPRPRWSGSKAPWLFAATGLSLALAAVLPRLSSSSPSARSPVAGVSLHAAATLPPPAPALPPATPSVAALASPTATPSSSSPPLLRAASSRIVPPRRNAKGVPVAAPGPRGPSASDLLKPDY